MCYVCCVLFSRQFFFGTLIPWQQYGNLPHNFSTSFFFSPANSGHSIFCKHTDCIQVFSNVTKRRFESKNDVSSHPQSPLPHYLGSITQVCTWEHVSLFCQGEDSGCRLNSAAERGRPWYEECPTGGAGTTTGHRTVIISGRNQRYQRTTQILMKYHKVDIQQTRPSQGLFYKQIVNNLAYLIPALSFQKIY